MDTVEDPGEGFHQFHPFAAASITRLLADEGHEILPVEECVRLYCLLKPLVLAWQRHGTLNFRIVTKVLNRLLDPLTAALIRVLDSALQAVGVRACHCLLLSYRRL